MGRLLNSYKIELGFTGLAIISFAAYLIYGFNSYKIPSTPLMDGVLNAVLIWIVFLQYLFILAKVAVAEPPVNHKWWVFSCILITGHFGAWVYSLLSNKRLVQSAQNPQSRKPSKGKVIHARVLQEDPEKIKSMDI